MADDRKAKSLAELLDELVAVDIEEKPEMVSKLLDSFWNYYKAQGRHSYHEVTEYILKNMRKKKESEAISVIAENLKKLIDVLKVECACTDEITYFDCKKEIDPFDCAKNHDVEGGFYNCYDYKKLYRFLLKLYDHIQLEFTRWIEIKKETTHLGTINSKLRKQLRETQEQQESLEEQYWHTFSEFDDVREQTKSMYMQVISILGIFAAIVIAVFGGLNVISAITNAFMAGEITIYRTVFVVAISALFVFWLLFILLSLARWRIEDGLPNKFFVIAFIGISLVCIGSIIWSICNMQNGEVIQAVSEIKK